MPPFLPVFSISRSQSVRLGRGPGNQLVPELNSGDTLTSPQTGGLIGPFYADLGNPFTRRDYQHHQAFGALIDVGASSNTTYTDLFAVSGFTVANPSGLGITTTAGIIQSRYSGAQIAVPAASLTLNAAPALGTRTDLVVVSNAGVVSIIPGAADVAAPVYDVNTLSVTATPAGNYKLAVNYNGFTYITANIASATATGANVATAVLAATGGPNNAALSAVVPGGTLTGAGAAFSGASSQTLTAGGSLEGPLNISILSNAVTGAVLSLTHTTVGVGAQAQDPNGTYLVLGMANVTSGGTVTLGTGMTLTA